MDRLWVLVVVVLACGGRAAAPAASPESGRAPVSAEAPSDAPAAAPSGSGSASEGEPVAADTDRRRCYPYLPAADGTCPTSCRSIDQCAGSRGPADFAENGWPLDCINGRCVPLPPDHVTGRP